MAEFCATHNYALFGQVSFGTRGKEQQNMADSNIKDKLHKLVNAL